MNKNTKMILGVGAVAIVGYLIWKQMPKKNFANLRGGGGGLELMEVANCAAGYQEKYTDSTGQEMYICCDPRYKSKSAKDKKCNIGTGGTIQQSF